MIHRYLDLGFVEDGLALGIVRAWYLGEKARGGHRCGSFNKRMEVLGNGANDGRFEGCDLFAQ